jgi:hypothetical protein
MRLLIAGAGAVVALGFLAASAVANYLFGQSLGRTPWEGVLYGAVGVLAVALNALAPFYMSWALAAARRTTAAAIALLWTLCLVYSLTSALGFAAQNREGVAVSRQQSQDAYQDARLELRDLEARRAAARPKDRPALDVRIDDVRHRLDQLRADRPQPVDAQSAFMAALSLGLFEPHQIRIALTILFSLMIEVGATIGLFVALSQVSASPPSRPAPRAEIPRAGQWTPNAG